MAMRLEERQGESDGLPKSPVFTSEVGTTLIPGKVAKRVLWPATAAATLTVNGNDEDAEPFPVTFHTFRHTCASLLFEEGRNIYVHLMDTGVGDAEFLDEAVKREPED
jgi:integrase